MKMYGTMTLYCNRLQRYLRVPRQAPDVGCTTQDDCLPTDLQGTGVPGGLVTCNNGELHAKVPTLHVGHFGV